VEWNEVACEGVVLQLDRDQRWFHLKIEHIRHDLAVLVVSVDSSTDGVGNCLLLCNV
jgi:hypothetical protein